MEQADNLQNNVDENNVDENNVDELDNSPLLSEVLGNALDKCKMFHVKLKEEGLVRGLVGPRDMNILWERHILNSAAVVPFVKKAVEKSNKKSIADVGSGGGFPGIVVAACLPDCKVTLIEPMERRVLWLKECVDVMDLKNVTVFHGRSDEVIAKVKSHEIPAFDVVTCRAVAPMTKLAGWTIPLLGKNGQLIALKGKSAQAEIDKAEKMIKKVKGLNPRVVDAPVAKGLQSTSVVIIDKG
ncbi:16S rRNA (guanine(527)-N(7))-methyltransferase RsmG [Gardnerella vaginalis]|uniref:Ribosomal RNA small subunit methyltransferase G n=1 Tax=Gardnerella vaginalis TaxID=2702 RepID=A0A3E1INN4_GARVA|nr:16S rRNA (guanine(527)-N(7))-methyltransferase RsmG [Gardnerella vaginalis]RFD74601.1 16S rRNA (guanine(527)-N(7))-methyltransferase RsmG [Gardnerella vaginalis]